eukprot:m.214113 g.214113  ORF g.214113 m.214113 type:complete len:214 (-) comp15529_c0_seq13:1501-2142(-)
MIVDWRTGTVTERSQISSKWIKYTLCVGRVNILNVVARCSGRVPRIMPCDLTTQKERNKTSTGNFAEATPRLANSHNGTAHVHCQEDLVIVRLPQRVQCPRLQLWHKLRREKQRLTVSAQGLDFDLRCNSIQVHTPSFQGCLALRVLRAEETHAVQRVLPQLGGDWGRGGLLPPLVNRYCLLSHPVATSQSDGVLESADPEAAELAACCAPQQ